MTRTSRRVKEKPTRSLHTKASPSEERLRSCSSFRPAKLALTDRVPRYTAPCASTSAASVAAAQIADSPTQIAFAASTSEGVDYLTWPGLYGVAALCRGIVRTQ